SLKEGFYPETWLSATLWTARFNCPVTSTKCFRWRFLPLLLPMRLSQSSRRPLLAAVRRALWFEMQRLAYPRLSLNESPPARPQTPSNAPAQTLAASPLSDTAQDVACRSQYPSRSPISPARASPPPAAAPAPTFACRKSPPSTVRPATN